MNIVPVGQYKAVAVPVPTDQGMIYAQFGHSKEKHTPQVVVHFAILEGDYMGVRVPWIGYFTPETEDRTLKALRLCGWTGDDVTAAMTQQIENEVSIVVGHNEWNGKVYARVEWVNEPGGGGLRIAPMQTKDLRMFAAKLKAKAKGTPTVQGKRVEPPAPGHAPSGPADADPGNSNGVDDDIPF